MRCPTNSSSSLKQKTFKREERVYKIKTTLSLCDKSFKIFFYFQTEIPPI
jgi:hypothetical protein